MTSEGLVVETCALKNVCISRLLGFCSGLFIETINDIELKRHNTAKCNTESKKTG